MMTSGFIITSNDDNMLWYHLHISLHVCMLPTQLGTKARTWIWMKFGVWLGYDPSLYWLTFGLDLDLDSGSGSFLTFVSVWKALVQVARLFQERRDHIHTWELPSTTTVSSSGHWAGWWVMCLAQGHHRGSNKGKEGKCCLFTFPTYIIPRFQLNQRPAYFSSSQATAAQLFKPGRNSKTDGRIFIRVKTHLVPSYRRKGRHPYSWYLQNWTNHTKTI